MEKKKKNRNETKRTEKLVSKNCFFLIANNTNNRMTIRSILRYLLVSRLHARFLNSSCIYGDTCNSFID